MDERDERELDGRRFFSPPSSSVRASASSRIVSKRLEEGRRDLSLQLRREVNPYRYSLSREFKDVMIVRTCSVANFDASTYLTLAVSKHTEVDTCVGSERYALDDRGRYDGDK